MIKNICNKYTKINDDTLSVYHNTMSPAINKPTHCKSCVYYTSRNCRPDINEKMTNEHNFFG